MLSPVPVPEPVLTVESVSVTVARICGLTTGSLSFCCVRVSVQDDQGQLLSPVTQVKKQVQN